MSETTIKIDHNVFADLKELATVSNSTPKKYLRDLMTREKVKLGLMRKELTAEQQARADIVQETEASEALEGYAPLAEIGGYAYELQQQWILGEITSEEQISLLKKHGGIK